VIGTTDNEDQKELTTVHYTTKNSDVTNASCSGGKRLLHDRTKSRILKGLQQVK